LFGLGLIKHKGWIGVPSPIANGVMFMLFGLFSRNVPTARQVPFAKGPVTDLGPRRMTLDERKQLRREMIYQSVREHMVLLEIISGMYKFKVVALDERHHRFMIVIDVTTGFVPKRSGAAMRLNEVEKFIAERTFARYGVHVDSVYWRFHNTAETFARGKRPTDQAPVKAPSAAPAPAHPAPMAANKAQKVDKTEARNGGFADTRPAEPSRLRPSSRHEPVSAEEMRAFEQAIADGVKPPALHMGDLEYQSDLAPLETSPVVGGTQYGSL
jgi:hypothetical protein